MKAWRVFGRRAANDQQPGEARRTRHAGQALDRAQRVAAGAGDAVDFAPFDHAARDLARRPFADHDHFEALAFGRDAVGDFGFLTADDFFVIFGGAKAGWRRRARDSARGAGPSIAQRPSPSVCARQVVPSAARTKTSAPASGTLASTMRTWPFRLPRLGGAGGGGDRLAPRRSAARFSPPASA